MAIWFWLIRFSRFSKKKKTRLILANHYAIQPRHRAGFCLSKGPKLADSCRSGDLTGFHSLGVSCRPIRAVRLSVKYPESCLDSFTLSDHDENQYYD